MVSLYIYRGRMCSDGGVYEMQGGEYSFMRKQSMFSRLKLCLLIFSGVLMLASLNINFLLIIVPSILMTHHKLLMSQSN
jgi:hypothetical protein